MRHSVKSDEDDWKSFLPQIYRIGYHHNWMDYDAWSGYFFIEPLSTHDKGLFSIDKNKSLYISTKNARLNSPQGTPQNLKIIYTDDNGAVYTYGQKLEWRIIKNEGIRHQYFGRPSNIDLIEDACGSSSLNLQYYNWKYRGLWRSLQPEKSEKSITGPVLGVILKLKYGGRVIGTSYYWHKYDDKLKCIVEMTAPDINYREFAIMYAVMMNHCHPFGVKTDNTSMQYIH